MADSRFFKNSGALSLDAIAKLTGAMVTTRLGTAVDTSCSFSDISPLETASSEHVSFLDNIKYLGAFETSKAGACFVRSKYVERAPENMVLLVTEQPYYAFALLSSRYYPDVKTKAEIAKTATIASSAKIGKNLHIDSGAVIGENAIIGNDCRIGANAVISTGVQIGDNVDIGACSTISHAIIGSRVVIHRGVHIGQDGFGFAPSPKGIFKVPQLGRVLIGNDVEIGSGTCIDRGAGPDTIIGDSCKIDNLVQIGHNTRIGKYVMIAGQTGIAGSTQIDDGVLIGGQAGISGHVRIGAGAKIAAQAGIMTDIPPGATYGGFPAIPMKDWHRQTVAVSKLVKKKEVTHE